MRCQFRQGGETKGVDVCAFQNHRRGNAGLQGFAPTQGAQAPTIAGFEASKAVLGQGHDKVIPA